MPAICNYFRKLNTETTKYNKSIKINNNTRAPKTTKNNKINDTASRCKKTIINDKIMINNTRASKTTPVRTPRLTKK